MDLRSIVLYLSRKGLSVTNIHFDIVHTVGSDAVDYSTQTLYLRDARCADRMGAEAVTSPTTSTRGYSRSCQLRIRLQ
jgi:hypothetical protein